MWLIDTFEQMHNDILAQLEHGKKVPAENEKIKITVWNFNETPVMIGRFLGEGPALSVPEQKLSIGTWSFEISPEKTIYVPKWKALDIAESNFLGFSNEIPNSENMYMLKFIGKTDSEIKIKVYKK